jgi:hypothetical protein
LLSAAVCTGQGPASLDTSPKSPARMPEFCHGASFDIPISRRFRVSLEQSPLQPCLDLVPFYIASDFQRADLPTAPRGEHDTPSVGWRRGTPTAALAAGELGILRGSRVRMSQAEVP